MIQINEWLSISEISGNGNTTVTVSATSSKELEDRIKSLKVKADNKQVYVNIQQKAFVPEINLSVSTLEYSQEILSRVIEIKSNVEWTAIHSDNWFRMTPFYGGVGTTLVEIQASQIDSIADNRTGVIDFYYGDLLVTTLIIKQEYNIVFEVERTVNIDLNKEFKIKSNIDWYAVSSDNWFRFTPPNGTSGETTMSLTLTSEIGNTSRNGIINFYNGSTLLGTVSVVQYVSEMFYIEPIEDSAVVSLKSGTVLYSLDKNGPWKEMTASNSITIQNKTYFKDFFSVEGNGVFKIDGMTNIGGDITYLLGMAMVENYGYRAFYDCDIVDASKLVLPFDSLAYYCYAFMFANCTSLVNTPALPATNLDKSCYTYMFTNCKSLVNAPALPATNLKWGCYTSMFDGCISLVNAPELPATITADNCYNGMFQGCTSLVKAPELPATNMANNCYYRLFFNCKQLNNIRMLATSYNDYGSAYWVSGVSSTGTFIKKKGVEIPSGIDGIPLNWTVVEID